MFCINTYLPRIDKVAKLTEFTNRHHFNLSKFYFNNDSKGICDYFDNFIYELLVNKEIYCEFTCIEKFIIWLDLYYNCLQDDISLFSKSLNDNVSVKIVEIIKKIQNSSLVEEKEITINDFTITLNAPRSFLIDSPDNIFNNIIYSVKNDNKHYYFENFTKEEKGLFLSSLPSHLFDNFMGYYKSLNEFSIDILPQSETIKFDPIEITSINGVMIAFLKSLFNIELRTHYSNALVFTKHFNSSYDSYFSTTLRDFIALYKVYESNMKQDKNTLNMPNM